MSLPDFYKLFLNLSSSPVGSVLNARRLLPRVGDYVAKGSHSQPIFLISVAGSTRYKPAVALRHVSVETAVTCRIRDDSTEIEGQFVIISCDEKSQDLFELFVNVCAAAILALPSDPSVEEIDRKVRDLVDLFSRLGRPGLRQIKGLWGELLVIASCKATEGLVEAWHAHGAEVFDFSCGNVKIEVKSTELPQRVHEFSVTQSYSEGGDNIFIVSMMLRKSAGGVGVLDLVRAITERLSPRHDLVQKVWRMVFETLGADFSDQLDVKFDREFSISTLRVYRASDLPQLPKPIPNSVFNIRYSAHVSDVIPAYNLSIDVIPDILSGAKH